MTALGDDLSDVGGNGSLSFLPWVRGIVGVVPLLVKYALATIVVVNLVIVISRNSVISERRAVQLGCLLLPALTSCPPSDAISLTMSAIPNSTYGSSGSASDADADAIDFLFREGSEKGMLIRTATRTCS